MSSIAPAGSPSRMAIAFGRGLVFLATATVIGVIYFWLISYGT
jgi:hypothetical protein